MARTSAIDVIKREESFSAFTAAVTPSVTAAVVRKRFAASRP